LRVWIDFGHWRHVMHSLSSRKIQRSSLSSRISRSFQYLLSIRIIPNGT
jgi:hypothetical protein